MLTRAKVRIWPVARIYPLNKKSSLRAVPDLPYSEWHARPLSTTRPARAALWLRGKQQVARTGTPVFHRRRTVQAARTLDIGAQGFE